MGTELLPKWDKKVLAVFMQWDYGDKRRGISGDKLWFYENLKQMVSKVEPFWYDDLIGNPKRIRELVLAQAAHFNPDLIFFIPYTDQFDPRTLSKLKERWRTLAWFGDDTWRFEGYSSKLAPYFTYVCTTDIYRKAGYNKLGINPITTQWAAQDCLENIDPDENVNYKYDVSFVGTKNEVREWYISALKRLGIKVAVFGSGWGGRLSPQEIADLFRSSKINLNLSNSVSRDVRYVFGGVRNFLRYCVSGKNAEQIKARNFEIPAAGGFQLTNYVAGLENYFIIGNEIAVYSSPEECARQVRYFLLNDALRQKVLYNGYLRTRKEHLYKHRLAVVLNAVWGNNKEL